MPSRHPRRIRALAATSLAMIVLAGCSGGSSPATPSGSTSGPAALLTRARAGLAAASTVHFTLTSADVPGGGTRLVAGSGSIARPEQFQGTLAILLNGSRISIKVISTGGTVYAQLPFSTGYQRTDPASFGLTDPARLIDPTTGIARMFGELSDVSDQGQKRIGADVVREVDGSLPGSLVGDLLTDADPSKPVKARLDVTTSTGQLRQVVLTGPFFVAGQDSTFTLLLDQYGAPVTITAPTTGS